MPGKIQNQISERCSHVGIQTTNCWFRWLLMGFGWLNVVLGLIGVVVPGMPTTVFLIAAAWAFSKSSKRFHVWLWTHPRFGLAIRNWHEHKVIPYRAKIMASTMMLFSFTLVSVLTEDYTLPVILLFLMAPAALYVNTRASVVPVSRKTTSYK